MQSLWQYGCDVESWNYSDRRGREERSRIVVKSRCQSCAPPPDIEVLELDKMEGTIGTVASGRHPTIHVIYSDQSRDLGKPCMAQQVKVYLLM